MELSGVWGAVSVMALVISVVTLFLQLRAGSTSELTKQVHQLELDVADQFDRLETWMNRDKQRRFRAGKVELPAAAPVPERGSKEYKQFLRKRAMGEPQ